MRKTKVLHLLSSNKYSGAENVVCTIIENQYNDKYDMYYTSPDGPISEVLKKREINFISLKKLNISNLKKIIKEYQFDVIHAHDFKASFIAARSGFNKRIISHLHHNPPFIKYWNLWTLLYKIVNKKFYKVAVVSAPVLDNSIFKNYIEKKTIILGNVVDKDRIVELSKEYKTKKYDLAFFGRLVSLKRPILFLNIVCELKKENPNIKAVLIGEGDLYEDCFKYIKENNLEKNVDFLGFKSNPFPIIKNSKFVVMPSIHEGLPMSAIETLCLNVPLLNSGAGGLGVIFKNNKDFICKDKNDYIKKIKKYNNNDEYKKLTEKSEAIIKDYINIKKWITKVNSLYK